MNRFSAFPPSPRLLRLLAAFVAVTTVPALASAQTGTKRPRAEEKELPTTVNAEQMTGRPDREVILERNVEITRGATTVTSDEARYDIIDDRVDAQGDIRMRRFGDTYTGDELRLKMDAQEGYVLNPTYHLEANNGQGHAERIDFEGEQQATVTEGTYSTCEGPDPDWYLKSSKLDLDGLREEGYARRTLLYFKGVPILPVPAMSFPLSDARKSGFLPPTIGTTNKGGLEISTPYYFNIAPNRDLTLFPKLISKRGLQLGAEARYLGESYSGTTYVEVLPNDREAKRDRYSYSSVHNQALGRGFSLAWNLNGASDDNYPSDFARSITTAWSRVLARDVALSYGGSFWNATARTTSYQVLEDPLSPIGPQYKRVPQVTLTAGRLDVNGFDWNVDSEFSRWEHPTSVSGNRFFVNPRIAYPVIRPGYFITPKLSLHLSRYQLESTSTAPARDLSRSIPTLSLDSGLVFERDAKFFGSPMTQTLEPRLFYVYTPYRDQSQFPLFDTFEPALSYAQLFSENRFVGNDRISDANQLTAALTSRYLQPNGAERMRFAVGQRYYFNDQRVTLGQLRNESRSDLLLSAFGQLTSEISVDSNAQYSQSQHTLTRMNVGMQWRPAPMRVLNVKYRRDIVSDVVNPLKQIDVSGQWPLARRWYGVARINYSLDDRKVAESLFGAEYKADCWVFRIVAQRTPTASAEATSALFFQLELNGLTRLGSNPLDALREYIPGYQLVNSPK